MPLAVRAEAPVPEGNRRLIEMGGLPVDRSLLGEAVELKTWACEPSASVSPDAPVVHEPNDAAESVPDAASDDSLASRETAPDAQVELFPAVWPTLRSALTTPRTDAELRAIFVDLRPTQMRDWLATAVERDLVEREERPVRYRLTEQSTRTSADDAVHLPEGAMSGHSQQRASSLQENPSPNGTAGGDPGESLDLFGAVG